MGFQRNFPVMAISLFAFACEGDGTAPDQPPRPDGAAAAGRSPGDAVMATAAGPSGRVLMKTNPGTCVGPEGGEAMARTLTLNSKSHLLLYFTFEWGNLQDGEEGLLSPDLDGVTPNEWGFAGHALVPRTSGTLMWSFANVLPGTHRVSFNARVEGGDGQSELNGCALTVFVIPDGG